FFFQSNVLGQYFSVQVARNLKRPEPSLFGFVINEVLFKRTNCVLESAAVELCDLRPGQSVLEIGFGPGLGIGFAAELVAPHTVQALRRRSLWQRVFKAPTQFYDPKDGNAHVYGIDISDYMLQKAKRRNRCLIGTGIATLQLGNVHHLPLLAKSVDACFHVNSFYFWPDLHYALQQIWRVLRPEGTVVTTFRLSAIKSAGRRGWLRYGRADPVAYAIALENCGFADVRWLKSITLNQPVPPFDAIVARKPPVHLIRDGSAP
ncbi:Methyltransferase, partial [Fasciolopsis buskii]